MDNRDHIKGLLNEMFNLLIARATHSHGREAPQEYSKLRDELLRAPAIKGHVPEFLSDCRSLDHFWNRISAQFSDFRSRKDFIWSSFSPAFERLETHGTLPYSAHCSECLCNLNSEEVNSLWEGCLERIEDDPASAVTKAKSLLESVYRHILDDEGITYNKRDDLPALHRKLAEQLRLLPENHNVDVFKQILGGCQSVVGGFSALGNDFGDRHGPGRVSPGRVSPRATPRHARLAVGLAGTMATFLVETWEYKKQDNGR